ncbi:unnamed protein product [Gadus morhua 'NCC']
MEAPNSNLRAQPEPEAVEPEESDSAAAAPPPPSKRKRKHRTLDTGHALYKSSVYCESEAGPGGLTAREWLISQQAPEDAGKVPRTTLWNIARRKEGQVGGSSSPGRKPH